MWIKPWYPKHFVFIKIVGPTNKALKYRGSSLLCEEYWPFTNWITFKPFSSNSLCLRKTLVSLALRTVVGRSYSKRFERKKLITEVKRNKVILLPWCHTQVRHNRTVGGLPVSPHECSTVQTNTPTKPHYTSRAGSEYPHRKGKIIVSGALSVTCFRYIPLIWKGPFPCLTSLTPYQLNVIILCIHLERSRLLAGIWFKVYRERIRANRLSGSGWHKCHKWTYFSFKVALPML